MEVELKLLIDSQYHEALLRHPLLTGHATSKPHEETFSDTYFDTPDLRLRHRNAGLRVRHLGHDWIQNMKSGGAVHSGLHSRNEWESAVTGPVPELGRLRDVVDDKKTRRDVLGVVGLEKRLAPIFTARVKRTLWDLQLQDGDHIECALDQGKLQCGPRKVPISELELELKSGDPAHLFDLALALQRDVPLHLACLSKADRGYALLTPDAPRAVRATAVALSDTMTVEQGFQAIAWNCLTQMQGNEQSVVQGDDVESLHQMRVGMRRLRSALTIFKQLLKLPEGLQGELDWLAKELGDARDWDVLASSTLPALARKLAEPEQIDGVQHAATDKANEQHISAAQAVGSPRYTRLLLNIARWVQTTGWRAGPATPKMNTQLLKTLRKFADTMLKRNQRRLRTSASHLRDATPEARHRVRIAAKKTRYAAEFFASLYRPKTVLPYIRALTGLQDELGFLNDAAIADRLLSDMAAGQPQLASGAGFARGFLVACVQNDDKIIIKLWKKFTRIGLPR